MQPLKPCRWRGPLRHGKFPCRSNRLVGAAAGVTYDFCNNKCPYVDHEPTAGAELRAVGPCLHLGVETGELENCTTCAGRVRLKVFSCNLHGSIVPDRACPRCSDYEPRPVHCNYEILPGMADPLPYAPLETSLREWASLPRVQQRFQEAFKRLLIAPLPRIGRAEGDGIVICGGGKYWSMIAIACHMARRFTNLPIQIWHRGNGEPVFGKDIRGLPNITIHDASAVPGLRRLGGWECKSVALIHCGFERVLFMDADAYLTADPSPLFALCQPHTSLVFWKDFPNHWGMVNWGAFGLPRETVLGPIQGGQLLFHRPAAWRQLVVSHWLNQHSDFSYQHGYGDQDQWRVAWAATAGTFLDLGEIPYKEGLFLGNLHGRTLLVHRVGDKLWGFANTRPRPWAPEEPSLSQICNQLRSGSMGAGEVFAGVYARGQWGPAGTSGRGSSAAEAGPYIDLVNELIRARGWQRVVDLGCGDGFVIRRLDAPELVGVDCVAVCEPPGPEGERFREFHLLDVDADRERLPAGDVALLKDVLHHWPTRMVQNWLAWALRCGKWKALVLTNDFLQEDNLDCELGGYRGLDPSKPPLSDVPGLTLYRSFLHKSICIVELPELDDLNRIAEATATAPAGR